MGNSLCRLILSTDVSNSSIQDFATAILKQIERPTTLYLRDLSGKALRTAHLIAARNANLRLLDIEPPLATEVLTATSAQTIGDGNFVLRATDDEDLDITFPGAEALEDLYPIDLAWALEPEDRPIAWNVTAFHLCPGNPSHWPLQIPVMLSLLRTAIPGQSRPCPMCDTEYTSNGERGQCIKCGFVSEPFRDVVDAKTVVSVPLDSFKWGKCPRCRRAREFTNQVEQCFRCGRLMEANDTKLIPNKSLVIELLTSLDTV